jgi:hypothetical protein
MKKYIMVIFATLILSVSCLGQVVISGKILDSKNNQPLIGASIHIENTDIRTISNEEGDFEIKTYSLPVTLIISHVGYKKERKVIYKADYITIPLSQESIDLAEVRIENSAISIINSMVEKSLSLTSDKQFYRAFYRRISSNNGDVSRIQEMFTNVSWNIEGIDEWQPINIRYAEVNPLPSSNSYILTFVNSAVVHKYDYFPINSIDISKKYEFKIKTYINMGTDDEIAIIVFKSFDLKGSGELYINTKKDRLLKIKGLQKAVLHGRFKKSYSFEANFRENSKGQTVFDNIFVTVTTGRTLDLRKAKEQLWLYFEKEIMGFEKHSQIYPSFLKSDQKILQSVPYNATYWEENIPFPTTDNIKKIIEKMEQSDKFTSNFN